MPVAFRAPLFYLALLPLLAIVWFAWHEWQGPALPGYRLELYPLVQRVVASGEVSSQSLARVGSEITGVVAARYVREGDAVHVGTLLLELHDDEQQANVREAEAALEQLLRATRPQAEALLRETRTNLDQATRERERRDTLYGRGLLSVELLEQARRAEIVARVAHERARLAAAALGEGGSEEQVLRQRLEAARVALARTRIRAQVDGIVQNRAVEPGDLVQPGRTLLEIARRGSREILLPLDEKDLAPVAPGQSARVVADAYPEREIPARVSYLAAAVDTSRGTLDVHLDLLEPAAFLRQGMTVSVNIETGRRERALVLPDDALFELEGAQGIALRVNAGRVERVPVRLGLRGIGLSEVIEGLEPGDWVLAVSVPEGQRVRLRERLLPGSPVR